MRGWGALKEGKEAPTVDGAWDCRRLSGALLSCYLCIIRARLGIQASGRLAENVAS
jgi:hypothetical protein